MNDILFFLLTFIFTYIFYEIFVVLGAKKNYKKDIDTKMPMEIKYLIFKYKLDLKKIDYNKLLHFVAVVTSIDITIIVSIVFFIKSLWLQIIMIFVLLVLLILLSYHLVYLYYKKKGMIKNV